MSHTDRPRPPRTPHSLSRNNVLYRCVCDTECGLSINQWHILVFFDDPLDSGNGEKCGTWHPIDLGRCRSRRFSALHSQGSVVLRSSRFQARWSYFFCGLGRAGLRLFRTAFSITHFFPLLSMSLQPTVIGEVYGPELLHKGDPIQAVRESCREAIAKSDIEVGAAWIPPFTICTHTDCGAYVTRSPTQVSTASWPRSTSTSMRNCRSIHPCACLSSLTVWHKNWTLLLWLICSTLAAATEFHFTSTREEGRLLKKTL